MNINRGPISYRFRDMAIHSLKLTIENCAQTAANQNMITVDGQYKLANALSDGIVADPLRLIV